MTQRNCGKIRANYNDWKKHAVTYIMKKMQDFLASTAANNMHVIFEIIKYTLILTIFKTRESVTTRIWSITYFCFKPEESRPNNFTFTIIDGIYNLKHANLAKVKGMTHWSMKQSTSVLVKLVPNLYRVIFQKTKHFLHVMVIHSSTYQSMAVSLDEKYGHLYSSARNKTIILQSYPMLSNIKPLQQYAVFWPQITIPSKLPTMIDPIGSYMAFPVVFTATNDAPAMARPVTAAPSCKFNISDIRRMNWETEKFSFCGVQKNT